MRSWGLNEARKAPRLQRSNRKSLRKAPKFLGFLSKHRTLVRSFGWRGHRHYRRLFPIIPVAYRKFQRASTAALAAAEKGDIVAFFRDERRCRFCLKTARSTLTDGKSGAAQRSFRPDRRSSTCWCT